MENDNIINCPECDAEINVSEALYHQVEEKLKKGLEAKNAKKDKALQKKIEELEEEKAQLDKDKKTIQQKIDNEVKTKVISEISKREKSIRNELKEETAGQIDELQKELTKKSTQLKELNTTKAEVVRLKREKDELRDEIVLEKEKEFSVKLSDEKSKIKKQINEESFLIIKALEKQLEEQKALAEEAVRKAKQGSTQLQGEIQELELENILRELYRNDEIEEIKKGQQGADIIQHVKTQQGIDSGRIYYESKRTKHYQDNWLQKLRDDNLTVKADVLVLVTEAMPDGVDKFFFKDGVWVCSFWEVKGLTFVLRHGLLQVHSLTVTQQGRESKMELLYDYLTSQEFKGQFEAIIEGFKSLQDSYNDEKLKMQKIWKERQTQLDKILSNAVNFYGKLKGIAGASIPDIKMLETNSPLTLDPAMKKKEAKGFNADTVGDWEIEN